MSSLRTGKGNNENRRSVFYTEEWEMLDPSPKDLEESMAQEEKQKVSAEPSKGLKCFSATPPPWFLLLHFEDF